MQKHKIQNQDTTQKGATEVILGPIGIPVTPCDAYTNQSESHDIFFLFGCTGRNPQNSKLLFLLVEFHTKCQHTNLQRKTKTFPTETSDINPPW